MDKIKRKANEKYEYLMQNSTGCVSSFLCLLIAFLFIAIGVGIIFFTLYAWDASRHPYSNLELGFETTGKLNFGTERLFESTTSYGNNLREGLKISVEKAISEKDFLDRKHQKSAFLTSEIYNRLFGVKQNQFVKRTKKLNRTEVLSIYNRVINREYIDYTTPVKNELSDVFRELFYGPRRIDYTYYLYYFKSSLNKAQDFVDKRVKWDVSKTNRELKYQLEQESLKPLLRIIDEAHLPKFIGETDYSIMILEEIFRGLSRNSGPLSENEISEIETATIANSIKIRELDYVYSVEITAAAKNGSKFEISGLEFVYPAVHGKSIHRRPSLEKYLWDMLSLLNWLKMKNPINNSGKKVVGNFFISNQEARQKSLGPRSAAFFDAKWSDFNTKY